EDFDLEKQVILEEIGMYEDMPSFTAYEKVMSAHFAGHPLGNSILGTNESIAALRDEQMREYHAARYHTPNITLAVTGRAAWDEVVRLAERHCGRISNGTPTRDVREARAGRQVLVYPQESNVQQHVMQMACAPPASHPLRYAADMLSVIVGDD